MGYPNSKPRVPAFFLQRGKKLDKEAWLAIAGHFHSVKPAGFILFVCFTSFVNTITPAQTQVSAVVNPESVVKHNYLSEVNFKHPESTPLGRQGS